MTDVIDYSDPKMKTQIRVTERQNRSFITDIRDGAVIGYKYFEFYGEGFLGLELRGKLNGVVSVAHDAEGEDVFGAIELGMETEDWQMCLIPIAPKRGRHALYLLYEGEGAWELKTLAFFAE